MGIAINVVIKQNGKVILQNTLNQYTKVLNSIAPNALTNQIRKEICLNI